MRTFITPLLAVLALTLPLAGAEVTTFTTDATIAADVTTYDGQGIIVSNCTLIVDGPHRFASLILTDGAVLTHSPAPGGETNNRLELTISGDVTVPAGCSVNVSGRGYGRDAGPGAGVGNGANGGGGGSHGGCGGQGLGGAGGGSVYDLISTPSQWGSGGGAGYASTPGAGGGCVHLTVGGVLHVDGSLVADGGNSSRPGLGSYAGGGSGGSLWLEVGLLIGTGTISAKGGEGVNGGGGGGGRIAIYHGTNSFTGNLAARGGSGFQRGGAGTIFTQASSDAHGQVLVDNGGNAGAPAILKSSLWSTSEVFHLTASGAAVVYLDDAMPLENLRIRDGAILTHAPQQESLSLSATGNVFIETDGQITVSGLGYGPGAGPGAGVGNGANGGGGGSHGGCGGQGVGGAGGGSVYDLISTPSQWGSGGGAGYASTPGAGGGCVHLTVGGVLHVDGSLVADGGNSSRPGLGSYAGGGSGGSLWLEVGLLIGTGTISAKGGEGVNGGGGGGGRIAIYHGTNSFTGNLAAQGGSGFQRGGAGTIFTQANSDAHGQVLVDNGGNAGAATVLNAALWSTSEAFDVTASGSAVLYPENGVTLANLRVRGGAILSHASQQKSFNLSVAGNVFIETDGQINVAGLGYPPRNGPGAGGTAYNGNGGGGGHGGGGGGGQTFEGYAGGGGTYDSMTEPTDFGSGGANNRGGNGGGAIRLAVGGSLHVDGAILAYGSGAVDAHDGAGAGGSVLLQIGTLSGGGSISAAGGWSGGPGGGGGGGRVAIYYHTLDGFDTNRISVSGGSGGTYGGHGANGTVYLSPQRDTPRVIAHTPGGRVSGAVNHVDLTFNVLLDRSTFTALDAVVTTPNGPLPSSQVKVLPLSGRTWRVAFPGPTAPGEDQTPIGPHIANLYRQEMNLADVYLGTFSLASDIELALTRVGEEVRLEWPSVSGANYLIEASADLRTWTAVGAPLPGTGGLMSFLHSMSGRPRLFFRLAVSGAPSPERLRLITWGDCRTGRCDIPAEVGEVTSMAGGGFHSVVVRNDGTVVACGANDSGQTNVPAGLTDAVAVSARYRSSLALRQDGTVISWGGTVAEVPAVLTEVAAIAAGGDHALALRTDGRVVEWGYRPPGASEVPGDLTNAVSVSAGFYHSLAVKADGTVAAWGFGGSETNAPSGLTGVVAVAGGHGFSLALKADGTVTAWGHDNSYGKATVPPGLLGVVAIAAGVNHGVALREDGTVFAWGDQTYGTGAVPAGLANVVAIACGSFHNFALVREGDPAP